MLDARYKTDLPPCARWSHRWTALARLAAAVVRPNWRRCQKVSTQARHRGAGDISAIAHAVSYNLLTRLFLKLLGLSISQGALDAAFRRNQTRFDAEVSAILARLWRARAIYSDELGVGVGDRGDWG